MELKDFSLILRLDLSDAAPEGPGWYVYATAVDNGQGQLIRRPQRVSGQHALALARLFEQGLGPKQNASEMSPTEIVQDGSNLVVQSIQQQIAHAEEQARKIANLRRILQAESATLPAQQGE